MKSIYKKVLVAIGVSSLLFFASGCASTAPVFVPPSQRLVEPQEKNWPTNHFITLAYHDVEDVDPDQAYLSVSTDHLKEQFAWLKENGYQPVSPVQILRARSGGEPLPEKSVLLSFDDGYASFYTRVFPLLQAYQWPALLSVVGKWIDTPAHTVVDFGGLATPRDRFLTWEQISEMSRSGLVEIGAHTDNLHYGVVANSYGNTQPAAAARMFDRSSGSYESTAEFEKRLSQDVASITRKIVKATGKSPTVWVWPYGAASGAALNIIKRVGYKMAFTLEDGMGALSGLLNTPRMLVADDPTLRKFAQSVISVEQKPVMRVVQVDLDYVYDVNPAQMNANVDRLVQRIQDMGINTVFLQAFSDAKGDGLAESVYFPNRVLPMRADLFNRVAWQLRNRAKVDVYAWMPVLSFKLDSQVQRVQQINKATGLIDVNPQQYQRLSPFDETARQQIIQLYRDLASHAIFNGILFHDDALLSDDEDASLPALAAYAKAGFPRDLNAIRADPQLWHQWSRFKTRALIDFTDLLTKEVKAVRGPHVLTARNIFALPILEPESEAWFAQNLADFLHAYDWVVPMVMPIMENVPEKQEQAWINRIVDQVAKHPDGIYRTVFEIQARDWRKQSSSDDGLIPAKRMNQWLTALQLRGARNFGYYPDDFVADHPKLELIRSTLSNAWYPFK